MNGWDRAYANYDAWRTAPPPEPKYDWDDFAQYVHDNPDCGWDEDNEDHYEAYVYMMEEAEAEALAERMEADRDGDDRAYWASL